MTTLRSLHQKWKMRCEEPPYLYGYVLFKAAVVLGLLLALAGMDSQNVLYMQF